MRCTYELEQSGTSGVYLRPCNYTTIGDDQSLGEAFVAAGGEGEGGEMESALITVA